jgi:hypothetical protein
VALIEQVEDLDPVKITNDIYPMLSTTGGVSILSGTPSLEVKNTYFYNIMTRPDLQRPPQGTNPNGATVFTVDWREAAKYSLTYRDFVQLQAERLGPDSDVFRAVYNIEWIVLRNKFISIEELRQLEEPLFVPEPSFSCYVGWDPARGADRSVATCVYRDQKLFHHVVEWREMEGVDWESQLRVDILPFLKARSPRRLLIDSTRDDPVVEYAQRYAREMRLNVSIEGFKYTSESKDAIGKVLDTEMHQKRVFFPVDSSQKRELSHFREDFLGLERNYKGNILNLDHPSTQGAHNDYCTSLELALWASLRKEF